MVKKREKVLQNINLLLWGYEKSTTFALELKTTQSFLYLKKIKQTNTVEK